MHQEHCEGVEWSDSFMEHAMTPNNLGMLPSPAHYAHSSGPCGDSIELYLRVENNVIVASRFMPHGCVHTIACGSALTSLVQGLDLTRAAELEAGQVEGALGGLSRDHRHCAVLAVTALRAALRAHFRDRQHPWKRPYQRA